MESNSDPAYTPSRDAIIAMAEWMWMAVVVMVVGWEIKLAPAFRMHKAIGISSELIHR